MSGKSCLDDSSRIDFDFRRLSPTKVRKIFFKIKIVPANRKKLFNYRAALKVMSALLGLELEDFFQ